MRAPVEPRSVLRRIEPVGGFDIVCPLRAARAAARCAAAAWSFPTTLFGLAWSGAMSRERVRGVLANLPQGVSELYLHPATGPYPLSAPGYAYAERTRGVDRSDVAREIVIARRDRRW